MSEDLMKSIVILMQNGIGDTVHLYTILLALQKGESLSSFDHQYVQNLMEKNPDNKNLESYDDELRLQ